MKIVINSCFGGFGLSDKALNRYKELGGTLTNCQPNRDDPILVRVVEELGEDSWGFLAALKVVEIPDGIDWEISEYDGCETIEESHRSWS